MRRSPNLLSNFSERGSGTANTCPKPTAWLHVGLICGPLLATWLAFGRLGGWPQNDDPFYGRPVQFFVEDGRIQLIRQYGELTASSVGHIVSGAAVCALIDYSYRHLFLVCLVQQAAGAVAIYCTCCWLGLAQLLSLFISLSLSLFPLYFGHAFTFMTDGPATAWSAIGCCLLLVGLTSFRWSWLFLASVAIAWGYWIRQTNFLLVAIPMLSLVVFQNRRIQGFVSKVNQEHGMPSRRLVFSLIASLGPALISLAILESGWLVHSSSQRMNNIAPDPMSYTRLKALGIGAYGACLLVGWLCVPLLPWLFGEMIRLRPYQPVERTLQERRNGQNGHTCVMPAWQWKVCGLCGLLILVALLIPFTVTRGRACITSATGVFIQNGHFGPIFLSDMDEPGRWGQLNGVVWPLGVWQLLSVLSILSCACLAWWYAWTISQWTRVVRGGSVPDAKLSVACAILGMITASYILVLTFVQPLMDRYWLFLFPCILLWLALVASTRSWKLSIFRSSWATVWLVAMLAMSLVFTHDLLAWNDARWRFVNAELLKGTLPHELDAGRDVNAWFRMQEDPETSHREGDTSAWWSGLATCCIAVGPRPGWTQVDELPWPSWATGKTQHLLILERQGRQPLAQVPSLEGEKP